MRNNLVSIFKMLGLEVISDHKEYEYQTEGYIVVKNGDKYVKIQFYEDSYDDGYIDSFKEVQPQSVEKVEYV